MSSWMEALLAFDRMICITFPKRFKFFKLKKVLIPIILSMFCFILVVHFGDATYTLKWTTSTTSLSNSSSQNGVIKFFLLFNSNQIIFKLKNFLFLYTRWLKILLRLYHYSVHKMKATLYFRISC
jgi:hypothetical protein